MSHMTVNPKYQRILKNIEKEKNSKPKKSGIHVIKTLMRIKRA